MKALRTSLITAGLLAALGSSVMAQMGPGNMPGPDGQHGPRTEKMREHKGEYRTEHMGDRHARHLNELKSKLKLETSQENAWKSFAEAMQPTAMPQARPDRAALEKLTTPERIDQMQALHAQRDTEMKKRGDASKAFYASLNAEQKKTFDAETARFMGHKGSHHGMHGHHRF